MMEHGSIPQRLYIGMDSRRDKFMKYFIQLETMTIDLSSVLEIRDDQTDHITLVIGPTDAVDILVLRGADAEAMRKWLAEDHQRYLEYQAQVSKERNTATSSSRKEPPSTEIEPPF
jgi:hypothetical protein